MSTQARIAAGVAVAVVIIATFVIANGASDTDDPPKTVATTQTSPTGGTTVEKTTTVAATPTITIKDAKPVGGVEELSFDKGDTIKFTVVSDVADEVHVHGYDISKDVAPGDPVTFSFKATLEGRFEAELEDRGEQILEFEVNP